LIQFLFSFQIASALYLQLSDGASTYAIYLALLHTIMGIVLVGYLINWFHKTKPDFNSSSSFEMSSAIMFIISVLSSIGLLIFGVTGIGKSILFIHIASAVSFMILFLINVVQSGLDWSVNFSFKQTIIIMIILFLGQKVIGLDGNANIGIVKASFAPSPGTTLNGGYLNAESINRSQRCGTSGCHPDIYDQWSQSAHRFSSFNNPFYKASIDYLLSTSDSTTVRWCGSCHDPVMLYSGLMESTPESDIPEAHAGITCETCHGMVDIPDITGNANYVLDTPVEYPFSYSNGMLAAVNKMLIKIKPEAHREGMLNPLHKSEAFCATCHKVSLDKPINHYKWLRGQDEYDAWQASGVSYNAVASFYNPPKPLTCQSCHMQMEVSFDKGNDWNQVFGHFFPAANTALPVLPLSQNEAWLDRTTSFLQDGRIVVDIFGAVIDDNLIAPINDYLKVKSGQQIRFEVVVATKKIGHFFPGGTADSNEPWLEIEGKDQTGNIILSSGSLQSDKSVDPAAHYFRGVLLDGHGEFILKRNPHEWRTTLYNNSIPPGSADVIHYSWTVPESFEGEITLKAKLNYRKFNRSITENSLENIVDLPIIVMTEDSITISTRSATSISDLGGMRFNDYGIALLRQNNLSAALSAFENVIDHLPEYADGYVNAARALIKQGEFDRATKYLNKALEKNPDFPKAKYFKALIAKMKGKYELALDLFSTVRKTNPNDRVMLKHFGQTHYFAENWSEAHDIYNDVLRIDPEDADAHYNLMLIHRKLGRNDNAKYHSEKYMKYKPDEQARSISQVARLKFPHANNEAQPVHSHELISNN